MRNREVIEHEIDRAREDLEHSLGELKHVVLDKLDVKAQLYRAIEHVKYDAQDQLVRRARRVADTVRARPILFASIGLAVLAGVGGLIYWRVTSR